MINSGWQSTNATRRYPLDDKATGTGDDGTRFKDDVIADLFITWPKTAGEYAFLSGITVRDTLVTAVILAADSPNSAATATPLASISIPQPVTRNRRYLLESLYPGAGGAISFGDPTEPFEIRFSTPAQGLLNPRVAIPHDELPIPSMKKYGRVDALTGLVTIRGGTNIEVVKETVLYQDEQYDAMVIRLITPTATNNVLQTYSGPCSARPESRSCRKEGVEYINGVGPDCNGNIEIVFRNFTRGPYESCGGEFAGVTLDQEVGIDEVCATVEPGQFAGEDYCFPSYDSGSVEFVSASASASASLSSASMSSFSISSESVSCAALPFVERFDGDRHINWVERYGGAYTYQPLLPATDVCVDTISYDSSSSSLSSYVCESGPFGLEIGDTSRRNVLTWEDCAVTSAVGKRVTAHLQLTNLSPKSNGGIVLNFRQPDIFSAVHTYWVLQINRNNNRIELLRFNGASFVPEHVVAPPLPFSLESVYLLVADIADLGGGQVAIACQVRNLTAPGWGVRKFTVATNRYGTPDGHFGLATTRAVTRCSYWRIEDA